MWPAIIAAGGALLGGILGNKGAEERNDASIAAAQQTSEFNAEQAAIQRDWASDQAQRAMDFTSAHAVAASAANAGEAQKQRDFAQSMADTSYQRAVRDLGAAGMNPMLAYHQGGAATPQGTAGNAVGASGVAGSGSSAVGVTPNLENTLTPAFGSALAAANTVAQIEKTRAETEEVQARTDTERERPENVKTDTENKRVTKFEIQERTQQIMRQGNFTDEETKRVTEEIKNLLQENQILQAQRLLTFIKAQHGDLDLERAKNEAGVQDSWWKRNVAPYLPDAVRGTGSAYGVDRILRRGR